MKQLKYFQQIGIITLLLIIPICFWTYTYQLNTTKGKNFYSEYFDPTYLYLESSFHLARGEFPTHVDNPGAPTQLLGAICFKTTYWLAGKGDFTEDILKRPEFYLDTLIFTLISVLACAIFVIGYMIFRVVSTTNKYYWIPFLLQMSLCFFPSYENSYGLIRVCPEPFLMIWGMFWIYLLIRIISKNDLSDKKTTNFYWIAYGLLTGIGIATKLNFVPHSIFPLFILYSLRHKIYYFFLSVISFCFFGFFQLFSGEKLFLWTRDLFFSSGIYGTGKRKVIEISTFIPNLITIIEREKLLISIFITVLILFFILKFTKIATKFKQELPIIVRITLGIVVVMSIHFVMIAKHYHHRYLLPVSLVGVGAVILFIFIISSIPLHFNTKTYSKPFLGYILSFVLLIFMFFHNKSFFLQNYQIVAEKAQNSERIIAFINKNEPEILKIPYFGATSIGGSLRFAIYNFLPGNNVFPVFEKTLKKEYPNHLFYHNNEFYDWGKVIPIDSALVSHKKFIFQGWQSNAKPNFKGFTTKDSLILGYEAVYLFER